MWALMQSFVRMSSRVNISISPKMDQSWGSVSPWGIFVRRKKGILSSKGFSRGGKGTQKVIEVVDLFKIHCVHVKCF